MKRFLFASAALGVLAASFSAPASAQIIDLKQLCNPALGIKCPSSVTGTVKRAPSVKKAPKVIVQQPTKKVFKPQVIVAQPKKKVQRPVQIVVPKQLAPHIKAPDLQIAVPPKVRQPAIRVNPTGKVVVKPGAVNLDDLRKQLAKDLVGGTGGSIKVGQRPSQVVRIPTGSIDLGPSQVQADIVALRDVAKVAAAVGIVAGAIKVLDRTLTDEDIRKSSEDFGAALGQVGLKTGTLDYRRVDMGKVLQTGDRVVTNSGDRMVVENNGIMRVLRNDDVLLNRPGTNVQVFQYKDGSTRNLMAYEDGSQVETVRAPDGRVMRRSTIAPDGTEVVLFDDTRQTEQVVVNDLPEVRNASVVAYQSNSDMSGALGAQANAEAGRQFSLAQVRDIDAVRKMAPGINIDTIHFASNSAAIRPEEAEELAALGYAMLEAIALNPREVFLIEGHTDARGHEAYNLSLSDRRAESVALALIEYFAVPPENIVLQGYGEGDLLVVTDAAEQANRRAAVRRITPLLTDL